MAPNAHRVPKTTGRTGHDSRRGLSDKAGDDLGDASLEGCDNSVAAAAEATSRDRLASTAGERSGRGGGCAGGEITAPIPVRLNTPTGLLHAGGVNALAITNIHSKYAK